MQPFSQHWNLIFLHHTWLKCKFYLWVAKPTGIRMTGLKTFTMYFYLLSDFLIITTLHSSLVLCVLILTHECEDLKFKEIAERQIFEKKKKTAEWIPAKKYFSYSILLEKFELGFKHYPLGLDGYIGVKRTPDMYIFFYYLAYF